MNRIQFFVLTGLSSLVVLLLIANILLVRQVGIDQIILNQAQQRVNQGQTFEGDLKQLASTIYTESKQDQGLKDLLVRQQITYTPAPDGANGADATVPPAPAPTH